MTDQPRPCTLLKWMSIMMLRHLKPGIGWRPNLFYDALQRSGWDLRNQLKSCPMRK
jgi:hypothetical protein